MRHAQQADSKLRRDDLRWKRVLQRPAGSLFEWIIVIDSCRRCIVGQQSTSNLGARQFLQGNEAENENHSKPL
jgi:hypothetical protein